MLRRLLLITLLVLLMYAPSSTAADVEAKTGTGMHIWFDTGGPVGGTYNTVVYNGAKAAANDIGAKITFVYSDWSPEKMIENFKKAIAVREVGKVLGFVKTLKKKGKSGIFISHNLHHVHEVADRFLFIQHGKVMSEVHRKDASPEILIETLMKCS